MIMRILSFVIMFCMYSGLALSQDHAPRGLFVSVVHDPQVLASRDEIKKLVAFAKQSQIKILFVQVYRANMAWFPSKIADATPYHMCVKNISGDPLALLIKAAHAEGIAVHAWLNLLSLSANKDAMIVKKYGMDILTRDLKKKHTMEDYKIDKQYFLEAGDPRVREDLSGIVTEVLTTYPNLDGIQFDYIRYPDQHPHYGYTKINIQRFKESTGAQTIDEQDVRWKNWKRDQVTDLLKLLVHKTHELRPRMLVSTTGCMPYSRAYNEAFQDWATWVQTGLVDFVTMMNYAEDPVEFNRSIEAVRHMVTDFKKVKIAVGAYKFVQAPEKFHNEFKICEDKGNGCVIFHYGSVQDNSKLGNFLKE